MTRARLREVVRLSHATIDPRQHRDELFEYYSIPAYQDGQSPVLSPGDAIRSIKLIVDSSTVLFGKLNPDVPKIWRVGRTDGHRQIASTEFFALQPHPDFLDREYLYFLCWSSHLLPKAIGFGHGSTPSRQRVDPNAFMDLEVPVPPLDEQRRIARILSTVETAKAASFAAKRALNAARTAFLGQMILGNSPIPRHWQRARLDELAIIERGKFAHRPRNDPAFYGGSTPFVQTGDVTASHGGVIRKWSQTLNERGLAVSRVFPKGTLLVTIAANIGYVAELGFDAAFPDSLIAITPRNDGVFSGWLRCYLTTQQSLMDERAPRGTQKNINIEFLRPWPVYVPAVVEQERLVHAFEAFRRLDDAIAAKSLAIDSLFQTMLGELFAGSSRTAAA